MKSAAQVRSLVEAALGYASPLTLQEARPAEMVPCGLALIDALTGGMPRACLTEISGQPSSGRTALEMALLASLTARGETCALIDAEDAFDPASAADAGVALERLLWVRCHGLEQALKATDLLLAAGGFGAVVLDLADVPAARARRVPPSYWFRFRRAVENTPTILAVIDEEPCARSAASLGLRLEAENVRWAECSNLKFQIANLKSEIANSKPELRMESADARESRQDEGQGERMQDEGRKENVEGDEARGGSGFNLKSECSNLKFQIANFKSQISNYKSEIVNSDARHPYFQASNSESEICHDRFGPHLRSAKGSAHANGPAPPKGPAHACLLSGIVWRAEVLRNRNARPNKVLKMAPARLPIEPKRNNALLSAKKSSAILPRQSSWGDLL